MEYKVINLPVSESESEKLINEFAGKGWNIICSLSEYKLILGKERPIEYLITYISPDEREAEEFTDILVSKGLKILGSCGENRLIYYSDATDEDLNEEGRKNFRDTVEMIKKYFEETND